MGQQRDKHFARLEKVQGQFFTPPEVAEFIVQFVAKRAKSNIGIDPSCGNGVFLKALVKAGFKKVIGIDLNKEVLANLPPELEGRAIILNDDGLGALAFTHLGDVVVGNPPFSSKYGRITDRRILENFMLGKGRRSQAIEVLFLERFLQLASSGGIIGIILPQGIFSSIPMEYVRKFVQEQANVLAIVSLPRGIFSNKTTSKTSILFAEKRGQNTQTFMAIANTLSDLPVLLKAYFAHETLDQPLAFWTNLDTESFDPLTYWATQTDQCRFKDNLPVKPLGDLVSEMRCGSAEYGEKRRFVDCGIPFITAKTITPLGLDLSKDPKYIEPGSLMDKKRAYVRQGDILFVRVGVGCSGRASVVPSSLSKGIADDWIYIIRTKEIAPSYLALFLQTKFGQWQINLLKRGVGTVTIPQSLLRKVLVPIPPISFQKAIEQGYEEMICLREANRLTEAIEKLKSLLSYIEVTVGA